MIREPIVVITGAGISAESGIPTFRGEGGLWREHRAQDLATPEAFLRDPQLVWEFYEWRRQVVASCEPNSAHRTLVDMEQSTDDFVLITQNVDGLHTKAGSNSLIELHGSLWNLKCQDCEHKWKDTHVPMLALPPRCPSCAGLARPDVVWFGEMLEPSILNEAERSVRLAGTVLVIGTSALVQPANILPLIAKNAGARLIEFNIQPTALSNQVDEGFYGPAGQELPLWWKGNSR